MRTKLYHKIIGPGTAGALLGVCLAMPTPASGQELVGAEKNAVHPGNRTMTNLSVEKPKTTQAPRAIVIGFVGGFVKSNDHKHQEVEFAAHIRENYSGAVYAEVFGNHERRGAFNQILLLLDADHDHVLTTDEKRHAKIILYGHSWGASAVVMLARELEHEQIPVQLTIQIDSIAKPGQEDSTLPSNIFHAVNFYQSSGLLHGVSEIKAADPTQTTILGNFQMNYKDHQINCNAFPWYSRIFTKPHLEIENDPRVWGQVRLLVDAELARKETTTQAVGSSQ
ncbi:MAG TPA: hypothetical protein VHT24_02485 [Pseudacidobacterium sp.]|jgi:hypothetical protein|nr:hypothetical protein [Pseudacidobacterium sp.]